MKRVVSVSSGLGSAYAWALTASVDPDNTIGVFADVNGEDEDNYRFLREIHDLIGGELVTLDNDGKTIWDVFRDKRFLGNSRVDLCSRILKREVILHWLTENCDPLNTVVILGIDWTEAHRFKRAKARWAADGWEIVAPLCALSYDKGHAEAWLERAEIRRPRLYDMGFGHANCGGGCVKAGIGQFKHLLRVMPDRYAEWETHEQELRDLLGDVSILRDRVGGTSSVLTLGVLRERLAAQPALFADAEWGACGCFTGDETDVEMAVEDAEDQT